MYRCFFVSIMLNNTNFYRSWDGIDTGALPELSAITSLLQVERIGTWWKDKITEEEVKLLARESNTWRRKIRLVVEIRTHKAETNMVKRYDLPVMYMYNNIFQRHPQGVGGARVQKEWHHHPWRRPVMAQSSGRDTRSSFSHGKTSWTEIFFLVLLCATAQRSYCRLAGFGCPFVVLPSVIPVFAEAINAD